MKKLVFLTGTRADFGKLKSLIKISQDSRHFEVHIFVTGMHLNKTYGYTVREVYKSGFENIFEFKNHDTVDHMDRTLAKTIEGFSEYISKIKPDLIIVHGDRVEALAGSIVGSLNNILVGHIEGGEVSGTIDELIRHAVSKMSHVHFAANKEAKSRLIQLGEVPSNIHIIGSPDLDLMDPSRLESLDKVKSYYEIPFKKYAIAMYHSVTTEYQSCRENAAAFVNALLATGDNYVVIYPNNDLGSREILQEYTRLESKSRFRVFPSLRFEYFLSLLRNASYVIGNSSAGIREAPYYGVPVVDIGSRQKNRSNSALINASSDDYHSILDAINRAKAAVGKSFSSQSEFGEGKSDIKFLQILKADELWETHKQKQFKDL